MPLPTASTSSGIDLGSVLQALPETLNSFFGKTTTQSSSVSAAGQNALLTQLLSGTQGLASVTGAEHSAGLYNSSVNTQLTNDLITRAAGQVNEQSKSTTTVQQPQLNPLKTLATTLAPSLVKSYGPQAVKLLTDSLGLTGPTAAAGDAGGGSAISGLGGSQSAAVANYGGAGNGVTAANLGSGVDLGGGATGTGAIDAGSSLAADSIGGAAGATGGSIELGTSLAGGALGAASGAATAGAVGAGSGAALAGTSGAILDGIAGYGAGVAGLGAAATGTIAADSALGAAAAGTAAGAGAAAGAGSAAAAAAGSEAALAGGSAAAEGIGGAAAAEGAGDGLAAIGTALVAAWVICTELQTAGELPVKVYAAASPDFKSRMRLKPSAVRGYHFWAVPYTRLMRKKTFTGRISRAIIRPLAIGRAKHIAGDRNIIGWFTFAVLEPICSLLGNTLARGTQNWKSLYNGRGE